ncbi:MAG: type restriction enzyme protein [Abditibacteriota bacterium]|nr:type restriction enzyme protein [Abditibacteriota bacterium]
MDNATSVLAKMNTILHDCPTADIWQDNSLSSSYSRQSGGSLKTFDFAVANPPFSIKAWSNVFNPIEDDFSRFIHGNSPMAMAFHRANLFYGTGIPACITGVSSIFTPATAYMVYPCKQLIGHLHKP